MPFEFEVPTAEIPRTDGIVIALVNNMPDAALEATENQFASLLAGSASRLQIRLRTTYLPEVPREPQVLRSIASRYWPLEKVLDAVPDAIIITGAEPRAATLEEEPYWESLLRLLDWTQIHARSSIWSCLAAHAVVQALDGIRRRRLPQKRIGVFEHAILANLPLLAKVETPLAVPHSRWNELSAEELRAAGYTIASASSENGVDMFVREDRGLLVGFQGHPEYEPTTLLKEYRRDVTRFLRGECAEWPSLPSGYFSDEALEILRSFRERAEPARDPDLIEHFPMGTLAAGLRARWRPAAEQIYRNWIEHLTGTRTGAHSRRRVQV